MHVTNTLSTADAAYIAGLIDGEGTVTLGRKHRNENRHLAVTISNTEKALLQYVFRTVGRGKITNKRTTRPHHTPSFTYAVYNRQALNLLEQIHPYLRSYIALTPRNGKYTTAQRQAREQFVTAVLAIKPE